jgi:two-component system LytT family response regulator
MKQHLRAVIIDDETNAREALTNLLRLISPDVEICGEAKNAELGIELIKKEQPNLVFLDIQMPGKSGFEMLSSFEKVDFGVIFTTAYQEYAIPGIPVQCDRLSAQNRSTRRNCRRLSNGSNGSWAA